MKNADNDRPLAKVKTANDLLKSLSLDFALLQETPYNEHNVVARATTIDHDFDDLLSKTTKLIYVGQSGEETERLLSLFKDFTRVGWNKIMSGSFNRPEFENTLNYNKYLFLTFRKDEDKLFVLFIDLRLEFIKEPSYVTANMGLAVLGAGRTDLVREKAPLDSTPGIDVSGLEMTRTFKFRSMNFAFNGDTVEIPKHSHLLNIVRNFAQEWRLDFAIPEINQSYEFVEATLEVVRDVQDLDVTLGPGDFILRVDHRVGGMIVYVIRTAELSPPFLIGI